MPISIVDFIGDTPGKSPSHSSEGAVISRQWKIVGSFAQAQLILATRPGKQLPSFQRWTALHRDETQT
jgi:hypothetical protein